MLTVPILIPVLTDRPLPLSNMADILGSGLVLTLGSFSIMLAGLDSGSPFGGIGSSCLGACQLGGWFGQFGSVVALLLKFALVALAIVVAETVQSRLRFFRYQEPLAAGFLFAVLAIVSNQLSWAFFLCQTAFSMLTANT